MSSAGKKTARFLLAGACDSYVPYVHFYAFTGTSVPLRSLRSLRWLEAPLYCVTTLQPHHTSCEKLRGVA